MPWIPPRVIFQTVDRTKRDTLSFQHHQLGSIYTSRRIIELEKEGSNMMRSLEEDQITSPGYIDSLGQLAILLLANDVAAHFQEKPASACYRF